MQRKSSLWRSNGYYKTHLLCLELMNTALPFLIVRESKGSGLRKYNIQRGEDGQQGEPVFRLPTSAIELPVRKTDFRKPFTKDQQCRRTTHFPS